MCPWEVNFLGVSQKVGDDLGEAHTVYVYGHILGREIL